MTQCEKASKVIFGKNYDKIKLFNQLIKEIEESQGTTFIGDNRAQIMTCLSIAYAEGQKSKF